MQLRDALDDVKRTEGHETLFPGERRTTAGLFSGLTASRADRSAETRLVHVTPGGETTDFGYPLSGLHGVDRARFGLRFEGEPAVENGVNSGSDDRGAGGADADGTGADDIDADGGRRRAGGDAESVVWFDDCETAEQSYHGDTALVVTEHVLPDDRGTATQYDLTLGDAHVTHVAVDLSARVDADAEVELVAFYGFSPDGRDTRIGQLTHESGVELFHTDEHDFVGSATGFAEAEGRVPTKFAELLDPEPVDLPRGVDTDRYEEGKLSGNLVCRIPLTDDGASVATLLTDATETPRDAALARLADLTAEYDDAASLAAAAEAQVETDGAGPRPETAAADLRVLALLSAATGLRIAGPDFDPYYAHSGGYGYTWFRDDAEISLFLLQADRRFDLGLADWHVRSAQSYCDAQREDGSWPHRVWPFANRLAPGWANGRLEAGPDTDYQADQTASVVTFLAEALDGDDTLRGTDAEADVRRTLAAALDGLDETLADDGLPVPCQNAWEDATGRFSHTTATFLEAYATAADATGALDDDRLASAAENATRVYDALDDLWVEERGAYAFRLVSEAELDAEGDVVFEAGDVDDTLDSASLALAAAHREYDAVHGVDDERLDRLVSHVESVFDALYRDPDGSPVEGLARYEGDPWRQRSQDEPKVWTVSTAWGANAAAHLAALLDDHDDPRAEAFTERARDLLALVMPDGPLSTAGGYLPEQFFDDGTADSATPLGWPHALRLATVALLDEREMLEEEERVVAKAGDD
ncbi:glycoside hydrolase family 15 protein [Halobium salinum]|uniref:Glycoside hydrolase family 15 protein n=1 Tax=Halobium salinum TaxID=1364940 RepID=A0ABD5PDB6_9EURY|nr:glycoside hydrolase family 15 protein [Halobium salinum]